MSRVPVLVHLDGDLGSSCLIASILATGSRKAVRAVSFFYGPKSAHNNQAAVEIASHYSVPFVCLDVSSVWSSLHNNRGTQEGGVVITPPISLRIQGLITIPILADLAMGAGADEVWTGIGMDDFAASPGCRPIFFSFLDEVAKFGTEGRVCVKTPFLFASRKDIVRFGMENSVPFSLTRSCTSHQPIACGECVSCQGRLAAFAENSAVDPIKYAAKE